MSVYYYLGNRQTREAVRIGEGDGERMTALYFGIPVLMEKLREMFNTAQRSSWREFILLNDLHDGDWIYERFTVYDEQGGEITVDEPTA